MGRHLPVPGIRVAEAAEIWAFDAGTVVTGRVSNLGGTEVPRGLKPAPHFWRRMEGIDIQAIVRQALAEHSADQQAKSEPAYKAELQEERKRREQLERRLNELVEENRQSRKVAEEAERGSAVRAELQRLGVSKIDLAFKAVGDGILRGDDGRLFARGETGEVGIRDYLTAFVTENPEFLPARIAGGTGMTSTLKAPSTGRESVELERIRPGMSAEEMQRVREEIVRVASQTLRGL
jgi:hypothetical protein